MVSISCNSDDSDDSYSNNTTTFKATLNGSNEFPSNSSAATGMATLVFYNDTKTFTLTGTYNAMTPTISHIHGPAMVGVNASPLFNLTVTPTPGYSYGTIGYSGSATLSAAQEADLMGNLYYVNVHSAGIYAAGEIRGQLIKQ
ncbi:CHRD domain-containing protein [Flavobacterium undicola]|uniref:CHRD domain-containing protein n=1 Tax=Flavobacterium undicola TaxID=1932779 RepID=UPI0015E2242B|nr:CHRD domain-containing protein [Flavobacterium undicola]MBA0885255.1 CHRD domain-containing protein [Flavobacterium undicola]